MIRYQLRCHQGHLFDGWYPSAAGYDRLAAAGQVVCPDCGSAQVDKALMAPSVAADRPLSTPGTAEAALKALRDHVEASSDDVGLRFAAEARAMHLGDIPERPIHGQARPDEARALIEDGVPVLPLPFTPRRQQN
ncbi:DUF1178 family protein [Paracoccus sp. p4-l81]|uniref:DUF1178 family protein n=1 Tax=unclassified Paracoccus (in: a-proteobacteria) TaxID=2688777 RepID=UPI0035B9B64A